MPVMAVRNPLSSAFWLGNSQTSLLLFPNCTVTAHVFYCKIACTINVDTEKIKRRLLKKGFTPTPKIVHRLRKKEIQKAKRKAKKNEEEEIPETRKKIMEEKALFEAASQEYAMIMDEYEQNMFDRGDIEDTSFIDNNSEDNAGVLEVKKNERKGNRRRSEAVKMVGKPWERVTDGKSKIMDTTLDRFTTQHKISTEEMEIDKNNRYSGKNRQSFTEGMDGIDDKNKYRGKDRLKGEDLEEFRESLASRGKGDLSWLLDDDLGDYDVMTGEKKLKGKEEVKARPPIKDEEQIQWLTERLNSTNVKMPPWQFSKLMHSARMKFTDGRLLKIVQVLGDLGNWRQAMEVVHWVHNRKHYKHCKGRYVYTTLLAVLGKARRPMEALNVFQAMREEFSSYPDMPAYHSIAITLGQAGYLKELLNIIDCLRTIPSKMRRSSKFLRWDPRLQPDVVVYNAVLNACIPCRQWRGAIWVLKQIRKNGLKPSSATYGLVMEVMLKSGKYDLVHNYFGKMRKAGLTPNALTYKVLVRAFWKEGKTNEAVEVVEEMECRGVIATSSVYYELACCLCNVGRWQDALLQVEKLCNCPSHKPLAVTFTGLIQSCAEGGHIHDCISIFQYMQEFCAPNIGTVNAMIKVYGQNAMFEEAKVLFEEIKKGRIGFQNHCSSGSRLTPDIFTYSAMLETCAIAHKWEYLENVYRQMVLHGHPFDQNRHSWLIIAASRDGKWNLLDHVLDQLLELGEIPHISLYKEKICQNLQAEEYKKVIANVNSMRQASLNISQKEWTELFKRNASRISKESLQELSNELNCFRADDGLTDHIFENLIKSLHSLTGLDTAADTTTPIDTPSTSKCNREIQSHSTQISFYLTGEDGKVISDIPDRSSQDKDGKHKKNLKLGTGKDALNPFVIDVLNSDVHNSPDINFPSSYEILKEWEDMKEKDFVEC